MLDGHPAWLQVARRVGKMGQLQAVGKVAMTDELLARIQVV